MGSYKLINKMLLNLTIDKAILTIIEEDDTGKLIILVSYYIHDDDFIVILN